ncbi:zonadhesin-like [Cotesia glomerata]|uniref:zonadhesin-like n=1 Tax=Cotesia glomerata TaxID=32391 RepID=UPI001D011987|nr:zonadhesin-like [Cotesia glomerata]
MFVLTMSIFIGLLLYTQVISINESVRTDCVAPGSICNPKLKNACCDLNTKCKLILYLHYTCDQERGLGKFCLSDRECDHIVHAKCSKKNRCVCRPKNLEINGTCVPLLEGFCWNNEECATTNAVCIDRECRCTTGFIQNFDQCISNFNNIACHNSDFCKTFSRHASCSSENLCECKHNYTLTEASCLPQLDINCENDEPCADENSACIENLCKCNLDYKSRNGECVPKGSLHDRCTNNLECNDSKFTMCGTHKRCTCRHNYFAKNGICVSGLGAYCQRTETCAVENSFCIDHKCQCMISTTSTEPEPGTDERCPEPNLLGKKCETNLDCKLIINSVCSMKKCSCDKNFSAIGQSACSPTLNGPCLNDDQCLFENFSCINKKCRCKPNFFSASESQCIHENDLYFCFDAFDCSDLWHSLCSKDKKCICQPDNIAINKSCLPSLNGYCWRHDQCMTLNSECSNNRCACKSDFIAVANNLCVHQ